MDRQQVFNILTEIFREVFDDNSIELKDTTSAYDIEDWDSLAQITLIGTIEKKFNMKFNMKDVMKLQNVGEMVDLIEKSIQL